MCLVLGYLGEGQSIHLSCKADLFWLTLDSAERLKHQEREIKVILGLTVKHWKGKQFKKIYGNNRKQFTDRHMHFCLERESEHITYHIFCGVHQN